jgi:hypothetical protein
MEFNFSKQYRCQIFIFGVFYAAPTVLNSGITEITGRRIHGATDGKVGGINSFAWFGSIGIRASLSTAISQSANAVTGRGPVYLTKDSTIRNNLAGCATWCQEGE